ncbi:hypothetical protein [Couchioplanes caeruleus]|uniref:Secreted protein n=2 Tax=Couchioplanes caeruleus TaxID=56438 RepID=A0A1K0GQ46_9ACTN|nr:hypothetical protein [Couchioplanes caeruleus]OJF14534.1 hypothetical protein BG844_09385 [Couchioplanes caeruleus subsp. caeruleus]ROP21306.1 hypothetical protein EDD30_7707 [Couchioplanes caeruleus]
MKTFTKLLTAGLALAAAGAAGIGLTANIASAEDNPTTANDGSLVEDYTYPNGEATPGIKLFRGNGRILLVECANGGANLVRIRSSVRREEFCFDVKGTDGYLALELQKTYQIRGDGEHKVEAEVTINGAPEPEPVSVPDTTWAVLPVSPGPGNTLVELRSMK